MQSVWRYTSIGDDARPPWWRSAIYALFVFMLSLLSIVFSRIGFLAQRPAYSWVSLVALTAILAALTLPAALFWRHRAPFSIALLGAGVAILTPLGGALALVGVAALIGRRRGPAVWWTTAASGLAIGLATLWDVTGPTDGGSFWQTVLFSSTSDTAAPAAQMPVWFGLIVAAIQMVLAIGSGLFVRARREAAAATHVAEAELAASTRLGDEVARRQERQRISREVHDAIGYRLSLINLQAGAIESNPEVDTETIAALRILRQQSTEAVGELHSLLSVLREPENATAQPASLSDLNTMIKESYGVGQRLSASIHILDAHHADPALSRAVYRVIQELLTNARKHAPEELATLQVVGSPETGIAIDIRNKYTGGVIGPAGSARGLTGIAERVQLLHGRVSYGLDQGDFRVRVFLPWRRNSSGSR